MGYHSYNIIDNLGSTMIYLQGYIIGAVAILILKLLSKAIKKYKIIMFINFRIQPYYDKMSRVFFFNMIIRIFLEGYLLFCNASIF
jgi:hypothetical protein